MIQQSTTVIFLVRAGMSFSDGNNQLAMQLCCNCSRASSKQGSFSCSYRALIRDGWTGSTNASNDQICEWVSNAADIWASDADVSEYHLIFAWYSCWFQSIMIEGASVSIFVSRGAKGNLANDQNFWTPSFRESRVERDIWNSYLEKRKRNVELIFF